MVAKPTKPQQSTTEPRNAHTVRADLGSWQVEEAEQGNQVSQERGHSVYRFRRENGPALAGLSAELPLDTSPTSCTQDSNRPGKQAELPGPPKRRFFGERRAEE